MEWTTEKQSRSSVVDAAVEAFFDAAVRERGYENANIPAKLRDMVKANAMKAVALLDILNDEVKCDYWVASFSYLDGNERISFSLLFDTQDEANKALAEAAKAQTGISVSPNGRHDLTKDHPSAFFGEVLPVDKPTS